MHININIKGRTVPKKNCCGRGKMPISLFLGGEGGSQNTEFFGLEISLRVEISFRFLFLSVGVIQIIGIPPLADNIY